MLFLLQSNFKVQSRKKMLLKPVSCFSYLGYFKSQASTNPPSLLHLALSSFLFVLIPARTELISAVIGRGCGYRTWRLFYTTSALPGAWEGNCLPGRGSNQLRKWQREPPSIVYYHLFSFCVQCFIYLLLLILLLLIIFVSHCRFQ